MPEVSLNQIDALWINAEADALEVMADLDDDEGEWLLAFEDTDGNDDPPPSAPARVIALDPWDETDEGMAA
jgi:hypothetical protein